MEERNSEDTEIIQGAEKICQKRIHIIRVTKKLNS